LLIQSGVSPPDESNDQPPPARHLPAPAAVVEEAINDHHDGAPASSPMN
jgi:hypothetical protein